MSRANYNFFTSNIVKGGGLVCTGLTVCEGCVDICVGGSVNGLCGHSRILDENWWCYCFKCDFPIGSG
ncbi:unnamed protein product, partial [Brugia timori]|uniref:LIM zinc-binding domain-containing protein n=1 Tax=Brugia timori TaxID=42155 RepID=A0A0R3QRF4_9BILA